MDDSRFPLCLAPQQRHSIFYEQTLKDSEWAWLPTDRSAVARNLLEKAGVKKNCHVGEQKCDFKSQEL